MASELRSALCAELRERSIESARAAEQRRREIAARIEPIADRPQRERARI
jgi:hypothetical protein